jgi:predicted TIM-barrel fold metal-dependent hydrolase
MVNSGGTILDSVRAGRALQHVPVVDFHTHLGASSRYYYVPFSAADEVLSYMDRYGVDHAIAFALSTTTDPEVKNRGVYETCRCFPRRFTALTTLHALFPQDWQDLLHQGFQCGSRGIKLLSNYQGVEELTMDWSPAFDVVRDRGCVVLHHDWRSADHLEEYVRNFPDITFIIGHPTLEVVSSRILERFDNVYQCTCGAFVYPGFARMSIEQMVEQLPLDKLLHGSDALDLDFGTAIGSLAYAAIPEKAKEKILGGNALTLMNKLGWKIPGVTER